MVWVALTRRADFGGHCANFGTGPFSLLLRSLVGTQPALVQRFLYTLAPLLGAEGLPITHPQLWQAVVHDLPQLLRGRTSMEEEADCLLCKGIGAPDLLFRPPTGPGAAKTAIVNAVSAALATFNDAEQTVGVARGEFPDQLYSHVH
jgi:hypothetical protein